MDNYDYRRPARFKPSRFDVTTYEGKGPRGYIRSDKKISEEVCEKLTFSHLVDASDFDVSVSEGIVTLEGTVNNRLERRLSEDLIEDLPGVKNVHNHLTVSRHVEGWIPRIS